MATKVRIKTFENNYVHIDTHKCNYTLCGLETGGDESIGIMLSETVYNKRVNCPECIEIIKFCKSIKRKDYR